MKWKAGPRSCMSELRMSPSQNVGNVGGLESPEGWVTATDDLIEVVVEDACSGLKQQVCTR